MHRQAAEDVVSAVMADLEDRAGVLDGIDEDIVEEIASELTEAVNKVLMNYL